MLVSFPAFAQRVTVLGSTRNSAATSEGVSRCSSESWPDTEPPIGQTLGSSHFATTKPASAYLSTTRPTRQANQSVNGRAMRESARNSAPSWPSKVTHMAASPDPWLEFDGHEEVVVVHDEATDLRAVIAIHSTVLGPSLGGVRMSTYSHAGDVSAARSAAYADALRLSRAMTYKNALAGLPHGGGKAVIVHDPRNKPRELLHAFGRMVDSLHGRYATAGDVGMSVQDMDVIGEVCRWTTGRSVAHGGVGDSGILTAVGVHAGMRAGAEAAFGSADLAGRTVGVVGAGKVGGRLISHLLEDGAQVVALDPSVEARQSLEERYPGRIRWVENLDEVLACGIDVLSPNALGGLVTPSLARHLGERGVRLVCGGANNQLVSPEVADLLEEAGVLYTPDFCVNCGGVIQVAEELVGADLDRARAKVDRVFETTRSVLSRARNEGITPVRAAEREAEARIANATVSALG